MFRAGETLRVVVQGHDVNRYEEGLFAQRHEYLKNKGLHLIHTGGRYDSYLLLPIIPGRE
jgi:predicted acyl esterase